MTSTPVGDAVVAQVSSGHGSVNRHMTSRSRIGWQWWHFPNAPFGDQESASARAAYAGVGTVPGRVSHDGRMGLVERWAGRARVDSTAGQQSDGVYTVSVEAPSSGRSGDFASVGEAVTAGLARAPAVRVVIGPGTYREAVTLRGQVELVPADDGLVELVCTSDATLRVFGSVRVTGITIAGPATVDIPTVELFEGTLVLDHVDLRRETDQASGDSGSGDVRNLALAKSRTSMDLRDCRVDGGRVAYAAGATGVIERCALIRSGEAQIAVLTGANVQVRDTTITAPTKTGMWVENATAVIERCQFDDCGGNGVLGTTQSEVTVSDSTIRGCALPAAAANGRSNMTFVGCTIAEAASEGVHAQSGGRLTLRHSTISRSAAVGAYAGNMGVVILEDCAISQSGRNGILVDPSGTIEATNTRIDGAEAGAVVKDGAGKFTGVTISDVVEAGVDALQGSQVELADSTVRRCSTGVHAEGEDSQVTVRATGISDARAAVAVESGARITIEDCTVEKGALGLTADGSGKLTVRGCTVTRTARSGVLVSAEARLDARRLAVRYSGGAGLRAKDTARLEVLDSEFTDGESEGVRIDAKCTGRLVRCRINDNADEPVLRGRQVRIEDPVGDAPGQVQVPAGAGADAMPRSTAAKTSAKPVTVPGNIDELDGLAELNQLVGLGAVKDQVRSQINLVRNARQREAAGLPAPPMSRHLVFSGPPGTGKTTVARLYGRLLAALGALATGEVIEAGRSDLVGQYLGATALKTRAVVESALGGILFIDEAYTLSRTFGANSDLGLEAVDELVRLMENHRDDLVVIVAGYTKEITEFLDINPGLRSRFSRTIEFPAYDADELVQIIQLHAKTHHYRWSDDALAEITQRFHREQDADTLGNARDARTLFEQAIERQAARLASHPDPTLDQLTELTVDDLAQPS